MDGNQREEWLEKLARGWRTVALSPADRALCLYADKLTSAGFVSDADFVMQLAGTYPRLEFVTQHAESDYDFLARLCEHVGIAYWFEERGDHEVMMFSDQQ